MELDKIRSQISEIDQQIISLLSQRISLVPDLVRYKKKHNLSVFQPEREKQMYSRYWRVAIEKQINPELILEIFGLIIEESRNLQLKGRET